jgi:hypothetical protein
MQLLIMYYLHLPTTSSSLDQNIFPQHPVLKLPQYILLPYSVRPSLIDSHKEAKF